MKTLTVETSPLLMDFVIAAINMPQDERDQLESFTGEQFDIDGVAIGNYTVNGPKWVIRSGTTLLCVGGFGLQRRGVWRDFMLTTPAAWEAEHWYPLTRICRRVMDSMFRSGQAHRLECIVPARRLASRARLEKWYKVLGYRREAPLAGYCADGSDAVLFSRVGH